MSKQNRRKVRVEILNNEKIKITENGPYLVSGNVPLEEKIIFHKGHENTYSDGRSFPQQESYALCRCGHSKSMPFCDGSHSKHHFDGTETASNEPYLNEAELMEGPGLLLTDKEDLCAFARFCHKRLGNVWDLTEMSDDPDCREAAIQAACDCPAGRLVAWDKDTKEAIEPEYEPSIVVLQDADRQCSGPLWVRGGIPIESSDGSLYEIRNRVTLCRCGESENKPFCDAAHVNSEFDDHHLPASNK